MRLRTAVALGAILAAGCTTMPRLMSSNDLDASERRILELEREVGVARAEADALRQRVAELERAAEAAAAIRATAPESPQAPEPVVEESPAPPPARVAVEESDLAEPGSPGDTASSGEPAADAAAYETALRALRDGRVAEAEDELRRFVVSFPGSDLADNAWFWLGESRAAAGDPAGAIDAYRTAIDRYPEGNKIPDVLLKMGVALAATGENAAARESWSELVRRFPNTAAAEAARVRLEAP